MRSPEYFVRRSYPHFETKKPIFRARGVILKEKTHLRRNYVRRVRVDLSTRNKDTYHHGKEKEGQKGKEAPLVPKAVLPLFKNDLASKAGPFFYGLYLEVPVFR